MICHEHKFEAQLYSYHKYFNENFFAACQCLMRAQNSQRPWHGHLRSTSWTEMLGFERDGSLSRTTGTMFRLPKCYVWSGCIALVLWSSEEYLHVYDTVHQPHPHANNLLFTRLRFLPLGLILIGLIYQKGLTIAKTIKWLTAVTTTKRTGGLNVQIFEWIIERDSISSLFWKHHFVENTLMSKMSHIVSRRSVLARAQQLISNVILSSTSSSWMYYFSALPFKSLFHWFEWQVSLLKKATRYLKWQLTTVCIYSNRLT